MIDTLKRLADLLSRHQLEPGKWIHEDAPEAYIRALIGLIETNEAQFWRELNSHKLWGGIGSVANQALNKNPGIPDELWVSEIREFRSLMIEIGEAVRTRGNANPDIDHWLTAFENWNRSEI